MENRNTWKSLYEKEAQGQHTKRQVSTMMDIRELFKLTDNSFTLTQALNRYAYKKKHKVSSDDFIHDMQPYS
ncbi:jg13105 [Pararge aegeria aegeria]|uniref:Jg13105 protein n=1 Tax=Pararge aegeria aegeria TaxID=348720 RepID=A0A8S4R963_9NEOP|nr:jg13105 [Pararge aegeria aegeria]